MIKITSRRLAGRREVAQRLLGGREGNDLLKRPPLRCSLLFYSSLVILFAARLIGGAQGSLPPVFPPGKTGNNPPDTSSAPQPGQSTVEATWSGFVESARQFSLNYLESLPDFLCRQQVQRMVKLGGLGSWQNVDLLTLEVSYHGGKEHYKVILKDQKSLPPDSAGAIGGFLSQGDFGNALRLLFIPESKATFRREGVERLRGWETVRMAFKVPQEHSGYDIGMGGPKRMVAYRGHCWIALKTLQVLRLESEAVGIPGSVPVQRSMHTTDYGLVEIGGVKHWLPVRASTYLKFINTSPLPGLDFYAAAIKAGGMSAGNVTVLEVMNAMEYTHYRKFGSEVHLVPE
jgi:hypothetical protein